ncbi:MAG: ABC transporter permease [Ruminococcaceae bacterium]|nr:ABC transporter permease [Oscillospiraceae bacterium]HHV31521.1 ABC transporter permease [Clostridiales bacterium]
MLKYTAKRLLQSLVTLFIIATIVFSLMRLMPIEGYFQNFDKLDQNQIQAALKSMGLLDPLPVQLKNFYIQILHGDFGKSLIFRPNVPCLEIIGDKAPVSILMGLASIAIALVLGLPLGIAMARGKSKFWDKFGTAFIVFITAVPAAVYYLLIQLYCTDWFGVPILFSTDDPSSWILPTVSLALPNIAYYAMWLRRYMVDELNKDYIKLARAKGVSSKNIMKNHVFRNAFVPMVQYLPTSILYTVAGSIYIESLYSVPGMGGLLVNVIQRQDNNMVQALVLIYSAVGIVGLLLGDLLMRAMDPRISFTKEGGAR